MIEQFVNNTAELNLLAQNLRDHGEIERLKGLADQWLIPEEDLKDFINENIFKKLKILEFKWDNYGIYCPGATGLYLKHSDFHKIGKLLLNDGRFNGVEVISKYWMNEVTKLQLETPSAYKKDRLFPKIGTGYYVFISRDGFIFRDGANGQYIIVNKDKDILITIMSTEENMKNITEIFRNLI